MSNLDDLFSKRDKKKKSTAKSKFSTLDANEFAKQLEATASRADDDADFQPDGSDRFGNANSNDNLDEEWKPFDSEDNRDYSGLRILQWKVEDRDSEYGGGNEDGEKKTTFIWGANKPSDPSKGDDAAPGDKEATDDAQAKEDKENTPEKPAETVSEKAPTETKEQTSTQPTSTGAYLTPAQRRAAAQEAGQSQPAPPSETKTVESSSAGAYVPPHMRGKQGDSSSSGGISSSSAIPPTSVNFNRNRPNKSQPNILDTNEFPTLDSTGAPEAAPGKAVNGGEKFEMPKKAARVEPKSNDSTINLDNKFNALSTNN